MTTPTISTPTRPGYNARYRAKLDESLAAITTVGVSLGVPDDDLIIEAKAYGLRARLARSREHHMTPSPHDATGRDVSFHFALGAIGEELLARRFGTHAKWNDSGHNDGGTDLLVLGGIQLQVKVRQEFLCDDTIDDAVAFYAFVYHAASKTLDGAYIFCGLISPRDFRKAAFDFQPRRDRPVLQAVTAKAMTLTPDKVLP